MTPYAISWTDWVVAQRRRAQDRLDYARRDLDRAHAARDRYPNHRPVELVHRLCLERVHYMLAHLEEWSA